MVGICAARCHGCSAIRPGRAQSRKYLTPIAGAELHAPVKIGNFTDFYALGVSRHQMRERCFRPDKPAAAELQIRAGRLSQPALLGVR